MGKESKFSREEKLAAVDKVLHEGRTPLSVAVEMDVHENTIRKWIRRVQINRETAFTAEEIPEGQTAEQRELEQLRRRNRELEAEVEFLKKVSAYFARSPR